MKTQNEIIARIKEREPDDWLGFERSKYLLYLDYDHAKEFLKPETTAEIWGEISNELPLDMMKDYMSFAYMKADDERGISAHRSVQHCIAWLWLAEENDLLAEVESEYNNNYRKYGKPILKMICDHYGWPWPPPKYVFPQQETPPA